METSLTLIEIQDQATWEAVWSQIPQAPFPQSWMWGAFRLQCGVKVLRFGLRDASSAMIMLAQAEFRSRRFGMGSWFFPRGPILASSLSDDEKRKAMTQICEELGKREEFQKETLFWRMEPFVELGKPEGIIPLSFHRNDALNPACTDILILRRSEDELLAGMHEKTRYNIRLAERKGVKVRVTKEVGDIEVFLDLMDETAGRDGFTQHDRAYLKQTVDFVIMKNIGCVRVAELNGKILSANLEIHLGDTVTYVYGTSSSEDRNVMAPFALHWDAVRSAKQNGFSFYDFWGSNPELKASYYYKASWEGITRFKRGWGGESIQYVGTWDLPIRETLYRLIFWRKFFRD